MKIIEKDIGDSLDEIHLIIQERLRVEADLEIRVEPFERDALSNVSWGNEAVTIQLHQGIPTHALPHVFAVALQHVRQRLDHYPDVRRPSGPQGDAASSLRQTLRELVLAPEAEMHIDALELDQEWEREQRHAALKEMLRDPPASWTESGSDGEKFMALQYARFATQHPAEMWAGLCKTFDEQLPGASERGKSVVEIIRSLGWSTPGACLQALVEVRDGLDLSEVALIEDRRSGDLL